MRQLFINSYTPFHVRSLDILFFSVNIIKCLLNLLNEQEANFSLQILNIKSDLKARTNIIWNLF